MSVEIQLTEHPYVIRHAGIGGGEPMIKGTRIAVRLIAGLTILGFGLNALLGVWRLLSLV
jgi:uncharacterized protein (DUF433 family)